MLKWCREREERDVVMIVLLTKDQREGIKVVAEGAGKVELGGFPGGKEPKVGEVEIHVPVSRCIDLTQNLADGNLVVQ